MPKKMSECLDEVAALFKAGRWIQGTEKARAYDALDHEILDAQGHTVFNYCLIGACMEVCPELATKLVVPKPISSAPLAWQPQGCTRACPVSQTISYIYLGHWDIN